MVFRMKKFYNSFHILWNLEYFNIPDNLLNWVVQLYYCIFHKVFFKFKLWVVLELSDWHIVHMEIFHTETLSFVWLGFIFLLIWSPSKVWLSYNYNVHVLLFPTMACTLLSCWSEQYSLTACTFQCL